MGEYFVIMDFCNFIAIYNYYVLTHVISLFISTVCFLKIKGYRIDFSKYSILCTPTEVLDYMNLDKELGNKRTEVYARNKYRIKKFS